MEREAATAPGQSPEEVAVETQAALTEGHQAPTTEVPAQHGPGPPASSTHVTEPKQTPSVVGAEPAPEAEQIGILKAELAAVKQSLATYECTLQQLLGAQAAASVPQVIHQLQGMVVSPGDLGSEHEATLQTAAAPKATEQLQQQQEVLSVAGKSGQQALSISSTAVPGSQPLLQELGSATIMEHLLAADAVETEVQQQAASERTLQAVAAATNNVPAIAPVQPKQPLMLPHASAAGGVAAEARLQASASAPSFVNQIAAASTAQQPVAVPFVQRRSTFGSVGTAAGAGYEYLLHGSPAAGILAGMRPPSPHPALVSPPLVPVSRQQTYSDALGSQVQQAGPSGPVSIPLGMRTSSSPGPGTGYSASPSYSSSILTSHGPLGAGGLLPPLPGRQSRHSDPTFAAAGGVISPPAGSSLLSHSYAGIGTSTGLQQLSGPSLAHLGPMQADTAGSLSLSPDGLAVPAAGGRAGPVATFDSPDVMPSSSGAGADQFSGHQLQSLLQQGRGHDVAAEQLAMLQQYQQQQQQQQGLGADPQQQLLAAMSQLDLKDPTMAAMMTAAAAAAGGRAGGGLSAGMPLGGLWDTAAAAATLAAAGGLDSSQAALQQQALQAQALASLQAQADVQAYQQAQLVQQLQQQQQQQQYNPYLQQLLAAQAAVAAAATLRQHPGQAGLWPLGHPHSAASSSSSGRRSSRGGDVQPSGARDVRKGPALERSARAGAAAAAGRQPRSADDIPDWRRIFVGNIGWWVDEQMLQQVFAEYGTILDAQVMWNTKLLAKGKRVNREFAFISFVTPEEAGNAIRWLNGRFIEGITKDRDGLTVQFEAQGVGKSSTSQGHQPPPHLQQIINPAGTAQQTEQQMMLQQLQQQQQQQQGAVELLLQQQQQWPPGGELVLLQQLGLGRQELVPHQQGGERLSTVMFKDSSAAGGAAAATSSSALPATQSGQGL